MLKCLSLTVFAGRKVDLVGTVGVNGKTKYERTEILT